MAFLDALIIALITGGVSSLGTIAALKTDINWIKRVQQDQEQRIRKLEIPNERTAADQTANLRKATRSRTGVWLGLIPPENATRTADKTNPLKESFPYKSGSFFMPSIRD